MTTHKTGTHFEQVPVEFARKIAEEGSTAQGPSPGTNERLRSPTRKRSGKRTQSLKGQKAPEIEREDF